jgi:hypothetical protein
MFFIFYHHFFIIFKWGKYFEELTKIYFLFILTGSYIKLFLEAFDTMAIALNLEIC